MLGIPEIILIVGGLLLPLFAILDLVKSSINNKLGFVAMIVFIPLLGALIYLCYNRFIFHKENY
ncbi:MAG: hypothetical protein EOO47_23790 [Flavobacterium sp.]|nr:MAG: hypothetical protein EOO47_23790 [Flavobacterium sp.]